MIIDIYIKILEFFGFMGDVVAGLEIGVAEVKLLQLSEHQGKIQVDHYAVEPIQADDHFHLIAAIKNTIIKSKLKTKKVCVAISNTLVLSKIIKIPASLNSKNLTYHIESEIDKYFPYAIEELAFDYCITNSALNQDETEILLTAAKLQDINSIINIVHAADLIPVIIDVDAYAIAKTFLSLVSDLNHDVILFEITPAFIIIIVIKNANVWYVRQQQWEHESQLLSHIIKMYRDFITNDAAIIQGIYLSGSITEFTGLDKIVELELQVKCYIFDQYSNVDNQQRYFDKNALGSMQCYGLALRNIN